MSNAAANRIAACVRLDQPKQIGKQRGILRDPPLAAATWTTDPSNIKLPGGSQFLQTPADRADRHPGRARGRHDPPYARRFGFRRREDAPSTLV